jgi:RNA polymerase sigma-70 factor (sigma-E family)
VADYVEFVHAAQHRLRRTAFLMTGDWAIAADLTQEALIKLYVAWPRLHRGGGLATYARRTVVTTVLDYQRSRGRRPEEPREDVDTDAIQDGVSVLADRELLMTALRHISPRQRVCIVLRYLEGLSVAETAAAMGCSEGNVKSQTSAALTSLRRELTRMDPHTDWVGDLEIDPVGGSR